MVCGEEQDRFRHDFEDAESVLFNNLTEVPSSGSTVTKKWGRRKHALLVNGDLKLC